MIRYKLVVMIKYKWLVIMIKYKRLVVIIKYKWLVIMIRYKWLEDTNSITWWWVYAVILI
jgi:hypothetical protein